MPLAHWRAGICPAALGGAHSTEGRRAGFTWDNAAATRTEQLSSTIAHSCDQTAVPGGACSLGTSRPEQRGWAGLMFPCAIQNSIMAPSLCGALGLASSLDFADISGHDLHFFRYNGQAVLLPMVTQGVWRGLGRSGAAGILLASKV